MTACKARNELKKTLTCDNDGTRPKALMARSTFCTTAGISTALRSLEATGYRGAPSSREVEPVGVKAGAGPVPALPVSSSEDGGMRLCYSYSR